MFLRIIGIIILSFSILQFTLTTPVISFYKAPGNIKVLSIILIQPDPNNPLLVDGNAMPTYNGKTVEWVKNNTLNLNSQTATVLAESTAFRKYKNPSSQNFINYQILETKTYTEQIKPGFLMPKTTTYYPDYNYYLNRENICNYVDNLNVKEVWIWTHQSNTISPREAYLNMGNEIKDYWNYIDFGTVNRVPIKDYVPTCEGSYTIYNYNLTRGVAKAQENHVHQFEYMGNFLDTVLFDIKFTGVNPGEMKPSNPGCGWAHYPPNGTTDYDWYNMANATNDCEDWKPDRTGVKESFNCTRWSKLSTCPNDEGGAFLKWWAQSIPGYNNGLKDGDKELRNWWEFIENFDKAIEQGTKLYKWKYGDINLDGVKNSEDSSILLNSIFSGTGKIFLDLNDNNKIDLPDLVEYLSN